MSLFFFSVKDNKIILDKRFYKCEVLIPKNYFDDGIAVKEATKIKSIGIVAMKIFDTPSKAKFYQLTVPIEVVFNTDEELSDRMIKYDGKIETYTVLTVYGGNAVTDSNQYLQSMFKALAFMAKFNSAKFSSSIPYDSLVQLFKDGITKNSVKLGVPDVLVEMIISELCRDSEDNTRAFRFKINETNNTTGYNFLGIKKIPQNSSVLAALAFEDMNTSIRAAIYQTKIGMKQNLSPIEKMIHY